MQSVTRVPRLAADFQPRRCRWWHRRWPATAERPRTDGNRYVSGTTVIDWNHPGPY